MTPPEVRTTASKSGAASGDGYTLPPKRASVCAFAATLKQAALKTKKKSATRSRFPIMGGALNLACRRLEALRKGARQTERYPISATLL
jgi:hypothetical protein